MLKTIQIFDYAAIKQAIYKKFPELVALELNPTKVFAFLPNGTGLEIELFNPIHLKINMVHYITMRGRLQ